MARSEVRLSVAKLREKAEMCRRAADIPTQGGHNADSILLRLAEELEREADELVESLAKRVKPTKPQS